MTASEWTGFKSLLSKEILRFVKVISQTVWSPIVNASLYIVIFGLGLTGIVESHGRSYLEFLIPGLMGLSALNNSLQNSASSLMVSKFHGDLQDLKVVPLSTWTITLAYVVASIVRGVGIGVLIFILGNLFSYFTLGHFILPAHFLALVYFLTFGCLIFGCLGIFIGFSARSFEQINNFTTFIILPLLYLGGVFFSVEHLHPFLRSFVSVNPLFYIINGFRYGLLGVADISPMLATSLVGLFAMTSLFAAHWAVKNGSYQRF